MRSPQPYEIMMLLAQGHWAIGPSSRPNGPLAQSTGPDHLTLGHFGPFLYALGLFFLNESYSKKNFMRWVWGYLSGPNRCVAVTSVVKSVAKDNDCPPQSPPPLGTTNNDNLPTNKLWSNLPWWLLRLRRRARLHIILHLYEWCLSLADNRMRNRNNL